MAKSTLNSPTTQMFVLNHLIRDPNLNSQTLFCFRTQERPPEKKAQKKLIKPNKQYVGPGTFVPSKDSSSSIGVGAGSRVSSLSKESIPASLRSSSSLAQLDLYIPPYEKNNTAVPGRRQVSAMEKLTDEFGGLSVQHPSRRRESFPVS